MVKVKSLPPRNVTMGFNPMFSLRSKVWPLCCIMKPASTGVVAL